MIIVLRIYPISIDLIISHIYDCIFRVLSPNFNGIPFTLTLTLRVRISCVRVKSIYYWWVSISIYICIPQRKMYLFLWTTAPHIPLLPFFPFVLWLLCLIFFYALFVFLVRWLCYYLVATPSVSNTGAAISSPVRLSCPSSIG